MILRSQMQQFCWRQRPAASSPHEPSRARCAAWRFWIGLVSPGACAADDVSDWFPSFGRTGTECQSTDGIPDLARRVNVITALSATQAALAAKAATSTIPIVFQVGT